MTTNIASPHDLITAVPFLLGFHPDNSLVLIALRDGGFGKTLRIDLPSSIEPEEIDLLAHHIHQENATSAMALVYAPTHRHDGDSFLIAITAGLSRNGIHVHDAIVVHEGRYRSIICRSTDCCDGLGRELPDFQASHLAAEHVMAGIPMPYESIEAMAQSIAPVLQSLDPEWTADVERYLFDDAAIDVAALRRDGVAAIETLLDEYRIGVGPRDQQLVARVIGRINEIQVRDFAMGVHREDTFDLYSAMWRDLLRLAPNGCVAPIACIVAAMAYESGDGALAHKALDRAFADDATYSLALLLRRVFNAGWPPSEFAAMRDELHPKVLQTIFG